MSRVDHALSQLVSSYTPALSDEDEDGAISEERLDQNLKLARSILNRYAVPQLIKLISASKLFAAKLQALMMMTISLI